MNTLNTSEDDLSYYPYIYRGSVKGIARGRNTYYPF